MTSSTHPHSSSCCAKSEHLTQTTENQKTDPVCGMPVSANSIHQAERAGHRYWFCSTGCKVKFEADPERYVDAHGQQIKSASEQSHATRHEPTAHRATPETS